MWVIAPPVDAARANPKKNRKKKRKDRWEDDKAATMEHAAYARGAMKWVDVRSFSTTEGCVLALRKAGYEIWCTDLSQRAECLRQTTSTGALPKMLAICFGSESTGASAYLLREADKRVYLPLWGFADSLNLSVAAALCIQRLFHIDPTLEGSMSERERHALRQKWYPKMARGVEKEREYAMMAMQNQPALPFADTRRADEHRRGWLKKKTQKKNAAAGFKSWQIEEDEAKKRENG